MIDKQTGEILPFWLGYALIGVGVVRVSCVLASHLRCVDPLPFLATQSPPPPPNLLTLSMYCQQLFHCRWH